METSFGEWLRWTFARRGVKRADLAKKLGCSVRTVSNMFARDEPGRMDDVILSRLAALLEMSEPDLLKKWKAGLPDAEKLTAEKPKKGKTK